MNYIFTMTASGTCIYLAYMLIRRIVGNRLSEKWYYGLLKAAVMYFLIPMPFLKQFYIGLIEAWNKKGLQKQVLYYLQGEMIVFKGDNFWQLNDTAKLQGTILLVWILGTVLIGTLFLVDYLKRRWAVVKRCNGEALPEQEVKVTERLRQRHHVRADVQFINHAKGDSPFTIGFFKPIVFYDFTTPEEEKELLLAHELVHIKRGDMFCRFASVLVVAMHWYNPLAWWFKQEMERACEYSCDEQVLQGIDNALRRKYAQILIQYETEQKGAVLEAGLSTEGKETKKRIMKILNTTKKIPVMVSAMIMGAVIALNSLTVFAYEDVKVARGDVFENEEFINGDFALIPEGAELVWKNSEYVDNYVYHYDVQFVDVDGNVYEVHEDAVPCFNCEHDFVKGTIQKHEKNSDGGCKVYFYNATYCILCGYLTDKEYVNGISYDICVH